MWHFRDLQASNPYESMKIDVMPTYLSLLLQENAATMCNYSCSAFLLQDFDIDTGKLKVHLVFTWHDVHVGTCKVKEHA